MYNCQYPLYSLVSFKGGVELPGRGLDPLPQTLSGKADSREPGRGVLVTAEALQVPGRNPTPGRLHAVQLHGRLCDVHSPHPVVGQRTRAALQCSLRSWTGKNNSKNENFYAFLGCFLYKFALTRFIFYFYFFKINRIH